MTQWMPVLITIVTVVFGFFTYIFQKRRDRIEDLIKLRRSEYRKWIQSLYDVDSANEPDALNQFNKATNDLFLFASDEVMQAVGAFKSYMAITSPGRAPRDMKKVGILLAKIVKEMRNDCFETTLLTENEICNILPVEGVRDDEDS